MHITDKKNIGIAMSVWAVHDEYDMVDMENYISVTKLIKPLKVIVMSARPGRIAADFRIDLPRPRTVELRASEAFGKLNLEIFRALTGKTIVGTAL